MTNGRGTIVEHRLDAEGADQLLLAGVNDANMKEVGRLFGVRIVLRGDHVILSGDLESVERAVPVAHHLIELARLRAPFDATDVARFAEEAAELGAVARVDPADELRIAIPGSRKVITPRSEGQRGPRCSRVYQSRQRLVDEQDVRVHVHGYGERESAEHP